MPTLRIEDLKFIFAPPHHVSRAFDRMEKESKNGDLF